MSDELGILIRDAIAFTEWFADAAEAEQAAAARLMADFEQRTIEPLLSVISACGLDIIYDLIREHFASLAGALDEALTANWANSRLNPWDIVRVEARRFAAYLRIVAQEQTQRMSGVTAPNHLGGSEPSAPPAGRAPRKARRRGGSQPQYDAAADDRLYRDWRVAKANGLTLKEFAMQRGLKYDAVQRAIDRARKRKLKPS